MTVGRVAAWPPKTGAWRTVPVDEVTDAATSQLAANVPALVTTCSCWPASAATVTFAWVSTDAKPKAVAGALGVSGRAITVVAAALGRPSATRLAASMPPLANPATTRKLVGRFDVRPVLVHSIVVPLIDRCSSTQTGVLVTCTRKQAGRKS